MVASVSLVSSVRSRRLPAIRWCFAFQTLYRLVFGILDSYRGFLPASLAAAQVLCSEHPFRCSVI